MEAMTHEQLEDINIPWRPIVPWSSFKNERVAPQRVFKNEHEEMQKTAQMKRMEERWTEDEISVHHEEMQKTAQMKRMEERWTEDEISVHRIHEVPWRGSKIRREALQKLGEALEKCREALEKRREAQEEILEALEKLLEALEKLLEAVEKLLEAQEKRSEALEKCREDLEAILKKMSDERRKERVANKISANAEQTDVNFPDYSSKFKKGTFVLCSQFLPCAGGNDLEDSQQKQQTVNGIYQHTLRTVSHCPSVSDYIQRARDKCAEVCTNNIQDDGCSYHCMRDSYKTSLVEFCAKPKLLFDYCPEYDSIGQTVQKDIYTPCKPSNPFERLYYSSDLFFCDQDKCLQLRDASVSTSVTSLMTDTTSVSGDFNESWLSQNWIVVWLFGLAVILFIVLAIIGIFRLRGRLVAISRKYTKRGNPNNVQDENEQAALHNTA